MSLILKSGVSALFVAAALSLSACGGSDADSNSNGADGANQPDKPAGVDDSVREDLAYSSFEIDLPENLRPLASDAYAIYAVKPSIRFSVSEDNMLDTYWEGELSPSADGHRHLSRISLASKSIVSDIPIPQQVNLGNTSFLGYEYLGNGRYIMGVSDVNASDIDRKHPVYYAFDRTGKLNYALDLWKDTPDAYAAARSGQGLIVYNQQIDNFGIYLARRGDGGHQAAWLSFHEAATGRQTFSRPWYISHNFDHRLLPLKDGRYLASAHADSLPARGLLIEAWKFNDDPFARTWSSAFQFPPSATGNYNITNSATGDVLELSDGKVAVLFTTQHQFGANDLTRDIRLSTFSNVGASKNSAVLAKDAWLTSYTPTSTAGWGAQMAHYAPGKIFAVWNVFDAGNPSNLLKATMAIVDENGAVSSQKDIVLPAGKRATAGAVQPSQTIRTTANGKYLVFMSEGSAPNKLRVNLVAINK